MKTNNIKPNYAELARIHNCDYRTVKKYDNGYEDIINMSYGDYKRSLEIDRIYYWDENPEVKTTITPIENEEVKKMVKSFDNQKSI